MIETQTLNLSTLEIRRGQAVPDVPCSLLGLPVIAILLQN